MSVRDAVIVSTARTPIGRAPTGAFNATAGATRRLSRLTPPSSAQGRGRRSTTWCGAAC